MKTLASNNNESINGMSQVVIDLRPQVKHQDGHGREVLADVHFRINVQAYTANLYTYTQEAREESEKACEAYYSEVVEMLTAEGWTLRKEKFGVGDCPQLVKGTQFLYCHPQDISGQVATADIEALEAKIKAMKACKYYATDNYGDIIVTTSESDEKQLYRDTYADGLGAIWQECTTTKRSNLYKDKAEAEHCVRRRICIANRRADLNDIGTGSYNMRTPLLQFLMEEYDRLLQAGYIKETEGQNGRTLCRWINKKEEKELTKARREAEKAEKERKAQEMAEREAQQKNAALEQAREISDSRKADGLTIGEGELVILKDYGGALGFITKVNGDELTFRHISGNWTAHPAMDEVARIEDNRPAWCKKGQTVIYNGTVYVIEVVDFYADIEHSLESDHVCCICEQGKECICQNCRDVRWECLTPCTPDGRELLPEPPKEVTLEPTSEITEQREQNDACISSAESRRDKANDQIRAAAIVREQQDRPGHVNTSWATDYTPDDFQKLRSRYEIADEDRDIMGRRFHTGEGLWTVDVFVSDYAGNEAHALIYLLTGEGEVRANVLSLDHLRATLTEAKGWHEVAA